MTKEDTQEIMELFTPILGEELARDIMKHRKGLKCPLTPRGAKALLRQYELSGNPVKAAEHHLVMGWRGFDAQWIKSPNFTDSANPSPRQETREEYLARQIEKNELGFARQKARPMQ